MMTDATLICQACGKILGDEDEAGHICDGMAHESDQNRGDVSDPDGTLDQFDKLVQDASVPDLATLFRRGKQAGLIQPGKEYGQTA